MNNREKLFALNADFQRLYYDKETAFFHGTLSDKVKEFIGFAKSLVADKSHPAYSMIANYAASLETELLYIEGQRLDFPSGNESKKDFYLLDMKRKIAQSTWQIFRDLSLHDTGVLEQII